MPPNNNTLQTIPPEIRNQIYDILAQDSVRVILGRKFLASYTAGEHNGILPVQFTCAAALEPISMTCRQLNLESARLLSTVVNPPAYHLVVNNFDLHQVALFGKLMDCPVNYKREFALRFQFDSGVLESALELERRAAPDLAYREVFRCEITKFVLVFALSRDDKVFGGGEGEVGQASKAMTESQARETVQVLRRTRQSLAGRHNAGDSTISSICTRFEALLDVHVWRNKNTSKAVKQVEVSKTDEAAAAAALKRFAFKDDTDWSTNWSDGLASGVCDSGSDSDDGGVQLPPHRSSS
jgi:hypothetical protein